MIISCMCVFCTSEQKICGAMKGVVMLSQRIGCGYISVYVKTGSYQWNNSWERAVLTEQGSESGWMYLYERSLYVVKRNELRWTSAVHSLFLESRQRIHESLGIRKMYWRFEKRDKYGVRIWEKNTMN